MSKNVNRILPLCLGIGLLTQGCGEDPGSGEPPAPTCTDGVQNGDETDLDCGGACSKCAEARRCGADGDCLSGLCRDKVCRAPFCGDGQTSGTEVCDDGKNDGSYGGCAADCSARGPHCGDGEKNGPEVCDDGKNDGSYGSCLTGCAGFGPNCGDGEPNGDEVCDDGINDGSYGHCLPGCTGSGPRCGDGEENGDEVCDDGINDGAYDGCAPGCQQRGPHCGDGEENGDEVCDDGVNDGSYDGCAAGCLQRGPHCGDGEENGDEVCDDGVNDGAYDGCAPGCLALGPYCGDGEENGEETAPDCGGPACQPCPLGTSCRADRDCSAALCLGGRCQLPEDCAHLGLLDPARPSGVYLLDPDGAGPLGPLTGYCDQDPAHGGGGWLLVLNYLRPAGSDPDTQVLADRLPLHGSDELGADEHGTEFWGHAAPALLAAFQPTQLRFEGRTSAHERVMDCYTDHAPALAYATTGLGSMAGLQYRFEPLAGHTTHLPAAANAFFSDRGDAALLDHPFYAGGADHWNVGASERWEVDGWLVNELHGGEAGHGYSASTLQRVWIRRDLCHDGRPGGDETDLDCGGSCTPCEAERACLVQADCASQLCQAGRCLAPACGDGVKNQPTEQCDAGGDNSDERADACRTDCQRAHCGDGVQDTGEGCDDGNRDSSDRCLASCRPASCDDGVANQGEGGPDCGGPCPRPCQFTVVSISPEGGAVNVGLDREIRVIFSQEVEPGSINSDNVFLAAADGTQAGGRMIVHSRVLLFQPGQLEDATVYTLVLGEGIRDRWGNPLVARQPIALPLGDGAGVVRSSFTSGHTNSDGQPPLVPNSFRPHGYNNFLYLDRKAELLVTGGGMGATDQEAVAVIDPLPFNTFVPNREDPLLFHQEVPALLDRPHLVARGNVDTDWQEEVVVLPLDGPPGQLLLLDGSPDGLSVQPLPAYNLQFTGEVHDRALAVGDLDQDGVDEIALALATSTTAWLWVVDDATTGFALHGPLPLEVDLQAHAFITSLDLRAIRVLIGDFDQDPGRTREVALASMLQNGIKLLTVHTFDPQTGIAPRRSLCHFADEGSANARADLWQLGLANVDGDPAPELISVWVRPQQLQEGDQSISWFHPSGDPFPDLANRETYAPCGSEGHHLERLPPAPDPDRMYNRATVLTLPDLDGDGRHEIQADQWIYEVNRAGANRLDVRFQRHELSPGMNLWLMALAVDDVDGSRKLAGQQPLREELLLLHQDGTLLALGLNEVGEFVEKYRWRNPRAPHPGAQLIGIDADRDSTVVEPVGRSDRFADNQLIAVLAAPPYVPGIGQNLGACSTTLGRSAGHGEGFQLTSSLELRVGGGFEVTISAGTGVVNAEVFAAGFELTAAATSSLSGGAMFSYTRTDSYTTGYDEELGLVDDLVVFDSHPHRLFRYRVVSAPDPDALDPDGDEFEVAVPLGPRRLAVTRTYYNATNGWQRDIDETILPSLPGQLATYPRIEEVGAWFQGNLSLFPVGSIDLRSVPQGAGNSFTITKEVEQEGNLALTLGFSLSVDDHACLLGACVTAGATYGVEASYLQTISTGTTVEGTVGGIPSEVYLEHGYDFDLFGYYDTVQDGRTTQQFLVIQYVVR